MLRRWSTITQEVRRQMEVLQGETLMSFHQLQQADTRAQGSPGRDAASCTQELRCVEC